jgi:FKBP-type peptidyl-prolyl cis-trans isomerase
MTMKRGRGGVEYEDVKLGEGPTAHRGAKVEVRFDLFLDRGDLVQENQHYAFRVGKRRAIPGLEYGVEGMRVGGERRLRIAPHLAYRDQAIAGLVPARAVLEFHVTLLRVDVEAVADR